MKKLFLIIVSLLILTVICCNSNTIKNKETKTENKNSIKWDTLWGFHYKITGNFEGKGNIDTLTEHFINVITGLETFKFYTNNDTTLNPVDIDFESKKLAFKRKIHSYLSSNNNKLDTLEIQGQFGLSYLKNIGDVNNDGKDEIALINDYADFSNLNTCHIYKFDNTMWKEIYSFQIHEDWIPCHDWEGNIINEEYKDPAIKISNGKLEVRICNGGDLKILRVNLNKK